MTSDELFRYLTAAGCAAPSADNMQPWQFDHQDGELLLRVRHAADAADAAPLFGARHPASMMTMGAVVENLVQASEAIALEESLHQLDVDSASGTLLRIPLRAISAIPNADLPLFKRHSNRLPFRKQALPPALRDSLIAESQGAARLQWIESETAIAGISRLIRQASEVRFQTREIHEWFARSLRFSQQEVQSGDGLDVATFDLPPGGRLLLKSITASWRNMALFNRIGGYRFLAAVEAMSMTKAGAIIALVGAGTPPGALDAGRLMQRIWIALNEAGYGVQAYYVVADQIERLADGTVPDALVERVQALKTDLASTVEHDAAEVVHLFLRIGTPMREAKKALRRPLMAEL